VEGACGETAFDPLATGRPGLQEISDLRVDLNREVDTLKTEFMELRTALRSQLDLSSSLAAAGQPAALQAAAVTPGSPTP
jgi:hypothetical protein